MFSTSGLIYGPLLDQAERNEYVGHLTWICEGACLPMHMPCGGACNPNLRLIEQKIIQKQQESRQAKASRHRGSYNNLLVIKPQ